jgi:hypothetical protein
MLIIWLQHLSSFGKLLALQDSWYLTDHVILSLGKAHRERWQLPSIERTHASLGTNGHKLGLAVVALVDSLRGNRSHTGVSKHVVSEVCAEDRDGAIEVEHTALVNLGHVANSVHTGTGGVNAEGRRVGIDVAIFSLEKIRDERGAGLHSNGRNVDVGDHGLAAAEVHFCLAVGGLGRVGDLGVVEDCDADTLELALGFLSERFAESRQQFLATSYESDAGLALEVSTDLTGGLYCDGAAATDDDLGCGGKASVHLVQCLDRDVVVAVEGGQGRGRADSCGDDKSVVRKYIRSLASCVSYTSGVDIDAGGGGVVEDDRVLELGVLLEAVHDGLEVLVVGCIFHRDELTRGANVPPEVGRLVDDVEDIFGIVVLNELWEDVFDDVVGGTQSSKICPKDNDVSRLRHDG